MTSTPIASSSRPASPQAADIEMESVVAKPEHLATQTGTPDVVEQPKAHGRMSPTPSPAPSAPSAPTAAAPQETPRTHRAAETAKDVASGGAACCLCSAACLTDVALCPVRAAVSAVAQIVGCVQLIICCPCLACAAAAK